MRTHGWQLLVTLLLAGTFLDLGCQTKADIPLGGGNPADLIRDDGSDGGDDGGEVEQRADWFLNQRFFPLGYIPLDAITNANQQMAMAAKAPALPGVPGTPTWGHPGVINGWTFAGPEPINSGQTVPASNVTGRITSMVVDPGNANHWYVGTAFGGVWETTTAGNSWTPRMDGVQTLTIGALAIAPSNGQIIYAGTGESVTSTSYPGRGVLCSTDGGASWTLKGETTFTGMSFSEIRVHPTNPQMLTATTSYPPGGGRDSGAPSMNPYGVYRSSDGGDTWQKVLPGPTNSVGASDLEMDPGNYSNQFAALSWKFGYTTGSPPTTDNFSGVYRTTDAGDNWTKLAGPWDNTTNFPGGIGRIETALCATDANVLYVSIQDRTDPTLKPPLPVAVTQNDGGMLGMWKTTNALTANAADITWTQIPTPNLIRLVNSNNGGPPVPQTFTPKNLWYAHQLIVDPSDSRVLYFGEVNMWKYDGRPGASAVWTISMNPLQVFGPVHSDQQAMAWTQSGGTPRLIIGNDGGSWYTDDGMSSWVNCNSNLSITQFYYGSIDPTNKNIAIAGAQDNGTSRHTGFLNWQWIGYGDGGENVISPTTPATHWATTSQNLTLSRTLDGSAPVNSRADWGINDNSGKTNVTAPFISRVVVNPFNENIMIAGTDNLWRSDNFFSVVNPSATNPMWRQNGPEMAEGISALAFSQSDPSANVYAFATQSGKLSITSDGGSNWTDLDPLNQVPGRYITSLAFDPRNDQILYVAVSGFNAGTPTAPGHVFKSGNARDAQPTWTDLSLPVDIPCNSIAIDAGQPHVIYVGTDLGLWQCEQQPGGGTAWLHYGAENGVPNIPVMDLKFHRTGRRLFAFTHGRGLLVADLVPPDDAVGAAEELLGSSGTIESSNVNATHEGGEPTHFAGATGTHSIWFKWTPATGGTAVLSTSGTNFHSVMAVYLNGAAPESWNYLNLPALATADGANAQITFNAQAGSTYYIAVDGSTDSDVGEVTLGWSIADNTPPSVAITHPIVNSAIQALTYITGTAADNGGLDHVDLTLYQNGNFWNGSAWVATTTAIRVPVSTGGYWSYYNLPKGSDAREGQYLVFAHAVDLAGNISPIQTGVNSFNFYVDRNPPTVSVSAPANASTINTVGYSFAGMADDTTGLSRVVLFIRRVSDFTYWSGSDWVVDPYGANLSSSYNGGDHSWVCTSSLPVPGSTLGNGAYTFIALAIDNAGNSTQQDSNITVDYHTLYTWTGATLRDSDPNNNSTSWGTPENWFPYGVPDVNDIAIIDNGDTVDSSISRAVFGFRLIAGNLNFTNGPGPLGTLTTSGKSTWSRGNFNGIWTNGADASLDLTGAFIKETSGGAVINNAGLIKWTGGDSGYFRGTGGTCTINNLAGGTYEIAADGAPFEIYFGGNVFNNAGTFVRTGGTGTSIIHAWTFNNSGVIRCDVGVLQFDGVLNLNAGTTFAGVGQTKLNGTTTVNADFTIAAGVNVMLTDIGSLNCPAGGAALNGSLNWLAGYLSGTLNIPSGSTLNLMGAQAKNMAGGTVINNSGTVNWSGGDGGWLVGTGGSCTVNNLATGVYNVTVDGPPFENYNAGNVFNNAGTLAKTGGTVLSSLHAWTFNNTGTIRNDTGALAFESMLNINAGSVFTGAGAFKFNGTVNANAGFTVSALTSVTFVDGTLNCPAGGAALNGSMDWLSGSLGGTLNIPSGSTLNMKGAVVKNMTGGAVINNSGTVNWSGGPGGHLLGTGGNCTVNNLATGVYNVTVDGPPFENYNGGNVFNNAGTLAKTGGAALSSLHGWTFNNTGTVRNDSGTWNFESTLNINAGSLFSGAAAMNFNGIQNANAPFNIAAGTSVNMIGGSLNCTPGMTVVGRMGCTGGSISGTLTIPNGSVLDIVGGDGHTVVLDGGAVINNSGIINWDNDVLLGYGGGCTVNNLVGGVYNLLRDGTPFQNYGGGNVFNNAGRLAKTGGSGAAHLNAWLFNNTGELRCDSGVVSLESIFNLNAGTVLAGSGPVNFNNDVRMNAAVTFATSVSLSNGSLTSTGGRVDGTLNWTNGGLSGTLLIPMGSTLNLSGSGAKNLNNGAVLDNAGTINWSGLAIQSIGGSTVSNQSTGVFNVTGDGTVFTNYGGNGAFNNAGVFLKNAGAGSVFVNAWVFNNTYKIVSNSGSIIFNGGELDLNAGSLIMGSSDIHLSGGVTILRGDTSSIGGHVIIDGANFRGHTDGTGRLLGGGWDWYNGTWSGTIAVAPTGVVSLVNDAQRTIDNDSQIDNYGTITTPGTGSIQALGNSRIANHTSGTLAVGSLAFTNYNHGNLLTNDGTIVVGSIVGTWPVDWDFAQSSTGRLSLDIGGLTAGTQFDRVAFGGAVTLGGALNVTLINSFVPTQGNNFTVLTYPAHSGTFTTFSAPGAFFSRSYNAGDLTLSATNSPANLADWKSAYFDPASPNAADGADPDHDGVSNLMEYATGGNPLSAAPLHTPVGKPGGGFVEFDYPVNIAALNELTFSVEWRDDLTTGLWSSAGVTAPAVISSNGTVEQVQVMVPTGGHNARFMHLLVTKN
jgi:hypothetical protein